MVRDARNSIGVLDEALGGCCGDRVKRDFGLAVGVREAGNDRIISSVEGRMGGGTLENSNVRAQSGDRAVLRSTVNLGLYMGLCNVTNRGREPPPDVGDTLVVCGVPSRILDT